MIEFEPANINNEVKTVTEWEEKWRNEYCPYQIEKFQKVLKSFGIEMSDNECQHYFNQIHFVDQETFRDILSKFESFSQEEVSELANDKYGFQVGSAIVINPIKDNGEILKFDSSTIFHEVLHAASEFLDENQEIVKTGISINTDYDNFRLIHESIIEELACLMSGEEPFFSSTHDLLNILKKAAPFELWVKANFDNKAYENLKKELEAKFGKNALGLFGLFCKYNLAQEFAIFVLFKKFSLPKNIDPKIEEEFKNLLE